MKFSSYQQEVKPGIMPAPQNAAPQRAARTLDAYGGTGKAAAAWTAAIGQVTQVLQKRQDDIDSADEMEAKNKILTTLNNRLYGENGLMRTGIGVNAKGLSDRVGQEIQNVAKEVGSEYNNRVRMRLKQHMSDNLYDFQRVASRQEWREMEASEKADFDGTLAVLSTNAVRFANDANFMGNTMESVEKEITAYGEKHGWTGQQTQAAINRNVAEITGKAARNAIKGGDRTTAERILKDYGTKMDPAVLADLRGSVVKDKLDARKRDTMTGLIAKYRTPGGFVDWKALRAELEQFEIPGEPMGGAGADAVAKGFAAWNGKTMQHGRIGCVEATLNILADGGVQFAQQEREAGVAGVPKLLGDARAAGIEISPFDESTLRPGDIVVYNGDAHVLVYEGDGMVVGNSSSALDDVYGQGRGPGKVKRQNLYQGQTPTSIIRTGSDSAGQTASRKLTPAEIDAWENYGRHMEAQERADRKAAEQVKAQAVVDALDGAGTYQDAMAIIEGSGLSAGQKRKLEAQTRRAFGITKSGGAGGRGSKSRGGYDPSKDMEAMELFNLKKEMGEKITASEIVKANHASQRLIANGYAEGGADLDNKDVMGLITDMKDEGLSNEEVREALIKAGFSEESSDYYTGLIDDSYSE